MKNIVSIMIVLAFVTGCASAGSAPAARGAIQLEQPDKWRLKIVFNDNGDDFPQTGVFEFQDLGCGGDFRVQSISLDGSTITLNQNMKYGNCVHDCKILINREMTSYEESCDGRITGNGELSKSSATEKTNTSSSKTANIADEQTTDANTSPEAKPTSKAEHQGSSISLIMWHDSVDPYTDSNGKIKIKESYENLQKLQNINTSIEPELKEKNITFFPLKDTQDLFLKELAANGGTNIFYPFEEAQLISACQVAINENLLAGRSLGDVKNDVSKFIGQIITDTRSKRNAAEAQRIENDRIGAQQLLVALIGAYAAKGIYDVITSSPSSSSSASSSSSQSQDCRIDGKYIMQNGKDIGQYDGEYIVNADRKDVGRYDGKYIVRISDSKDACRQDGKYVIDIATGKDVGTGDAAAVCLCAGLLY